VIADDIAKRYPPEETACGCGRGMARIAPWVSDPWHWVSPQVAVHDLFMNGDIMQEDMELFAHVLRRYIHLTEIS
jgi:hypothetical protein